MFEARVGVKEPHLLQKHLVSPRLKMARSGQGRRRLKTILLFHKTGEKPPPPSAKIRSRCCRVRFLMRQQWGFSSSVLSTLSRALLIWHLRVRSQSRCGDWVSPLLPLFLHQCFLLPPLLLLSHHRGHLGVSTSSSASSLLPSTRLSRHA